MLFAANLLASTVVTKSNTSKTTIHQKQKNTVTQNEYLKK